MRRIYREIPSIKGTVPRDLLTPGNPIDTGGKFATSINDTSGTGDKFTACVVDTVVVDTDGAP